MAQKKRGLGRGLQALIPETQSETPSTRPTDVFFPESDSPAEDRKSAETSENGETGEDSATEGTRRKADDIAATLLAPSRRTKKSAARSTSHQRRTTASTSRTAARDTAAKNSDAKTKSTRAGAGKTGDEAEVRSAKTVTGSSKQEKSNEDSSLVPVPGATFADLPVDIISANPHQPRQVFDEDDISELAASIKEVGLLQPIVVRRIDGEGDEENAHYELIMGERRLRAAKEAGLKTIPAVVRYAADEELLRDALLENLHRVQLNPLEEAAAYQQLLEDFNCTHAELSKRIARSRSQISNTLRLMKLPPLVQRRVAAGVLSAGHARALLGLPNAAAMERLAQRIVAEGLSVRATEEFVAVHDEPEPARKSKPLRARSAPLPALSTRLSDAFDTRVKVTRGAKKGRITIEFAGDDDLARIVSALAPGTSLDED
jgi:chromosome segregation DNA-binding protein